MASYVRVARAMDAMFYRFKKKDKSLIENQGNENIEKSPPTESEFVNVTAVQEFQVFDNETSVRQESTNIDTVFTKPGYVEGDDDGHVRKWKNSSHILQMDEISGTVAVDIKEDSGVETSHGIVRNQFTEYAQSTKGKMYLDLPLNNSGAFEKEDLLKDKALTNVVNDTVTTTHNNSDADESSDTVANTTKSEKDLNNSVEGGMIQDVQAISGPLAIKTAEGGNEVDAIPVTMVTTPEEAAKDSVGVRVLPAISAPLVIESSENEKQINDDAVLLNSTQEQDAVEDGVEKISGGMKTKQFTDNVETFDDRGSGAPLQGDDLAEGDVENMTHPSGLDGVDITNRKLSTEHVPDEDESSEKNSEGQVESDMEKPCSCDLEPTFFLNKVRFYPAFAVVNFLGIVIQYVFNALSSSGPDGTVFLNKTGDLSDKYYTAITPAGWTFSIWGFIYTWQAAWVVYSLVNICRKGSNGEPAYKDPPYIPNTVFILQLFISALNITWLITFDREEIEVAAAALIAYTLLQYLLLTATVRVLDRASPKLVRQQRTLDIWLNRGLLQNGIGIQLAWVNIATLLNIQMVLIYSGDELVCADTAGTIALSILTVHVVVLPIIDMVLLDRYTRYVITPYIVVIVALAGSISKNWDSAKENSIFSVVLVSYASVLISAKICVTIYRHFKCPRYTTKCHCISESTLDEKNMHE